MKNRTVESLRYLVENSSDVVINVDTEGFGVPIYFVDLYVTGAKVPHLYRGESLEEAVQNAAGGLRKEVENAESS